LKRSARKLRRLDPAHVREVAAAIDTLGFCDLLLIGRDNVRNDHLCDTPRVKIASRQSRFGAVDP
jgi:hypothetical protein